MSNPTPPADGKWFEVPDIDLAKLALDPNPEVSEPAKVEQRKRRVSKHDCAKASLFTEPKHGSLL